MLNNSNQDDDDDNNKSSLVFKNVINLSNKTFDPSVFSFLNKGLNFALAPSKIPTDDIIYNIEYGIKDLPNNVKETIRQDCVVVLRKAKPLKKNLNKVEFLALKSLRDNPDIVVLKADIGGAVVILDKLDYIHKMMDHVSSSGSYIMLKKNPIKSISKEVASTIKEDSSLLPLSRKLIESNPLTPRIYGLSKIHRHGAPLRPIVNTIGGPTYLLAKFLAQKLKPLVGRADSFIKESASFVQEWRDIKLEPGELLVSFDVVSLYIKIPIQEAIDIIDHITDEKTAKLVSLCLTSTFFRFQGEFYEKTCSVAMGSPLSPIVVRAPNLTLEVFDDAFMAQGNPSFQTQSKILKTMFYSLYATLS